ncbi:winged helix-turn-helix domain-containing protein [Streptomyces sp. NPDC008141]|uniref:winged helix-turn-helix domain-containing protein n=1 Tax=Streptomyces sp. NPDC008141 TaxID=3364815 RepID=UPI0036F1483A
MHGFTELRLGPLDQVRVSVAPHPGATLLSLVADALGGRSQGVPAHWQRIVRSAAPRAAPGVVSPLFAPDHSIIPDCLTPTACMPDGDATTQFDYLADLSPDTLLAEMETEFAQSVPRQWQPVVDRPRDWLQAYAELLAEVWQEFLPVWKQADRLFHREAERIGSATVRGCLDSVLPGISPRFKLRGTSLHLPDQQAGTFDLGDRRLVLVPIVSGMGASMFAFDRPDLVWIGYPVPGIGQLWDGGAATGQPAEISRDPLTLIAGRLRAAILRASATPMTMGELASHLRCSPANITYHCTQLQDAGLLDRERRGRHVVLRRTERGHALVELLSE